ncbi:MAG: ABC transporter permease subunit [Tissierellia bacterium]|nr:ABC transporter permease subunit [Tissierellia bacterium]
MNKRMPYLLLLPIILLGLLFFYGLLGGLAASFGYIPALGLRGWTFEYYLEIIQNPAFIASLGMSLWISVISSVLSLLLGVLLTAALVYSGNTRGLAVTVLKLAILIPHTIVALFSISILSQNGIIARLFYQLGWISNQTQFPQLLFTGHQFGTIAAYVWKEMPFVAYFSLALMSNINKSLGEAAENLGASKWKSFFYVTLPLSMPAIQKAFLIILTFSFGAYDLPFLLGATLPKALPVAAYVEYTHPDLLHRPYAMAANGVILAITWLMAGVYYWLTKQEKGGGHA